MTQEPGAGGIDITWHRGELSREERWAALHLGGATVWFTGLSGSGKSTLAAAVERRLIHDGTAAYLLDGDNLRHGLNLGLGFSAPDRRENVRRAAEAARLLADAGLIALVSLISPYTVDRRHARQLHQNEGLAFVEVWVDTPLEVCEQRDPKGLYARARRGEIPGFTGVDDPYEPPGDPELRLSMDRVSVGEGVARVVSVLAARRAPGAHVGRRDEN